MIYFDARTFTGDQRKTVRFDIIRSSFKPKSHKIGYLRQVTMTCLHPKWGPNQSQDSLDHLGKFMGNYFMSQRHDSVSMTTITHVGISHYLYSPRSTCLVYMPSCSSGPLTFQHQEALKPVFQFSMLCVR